MPTLDHRSADEASDATAGRPLLLAALIVAVLAIGGTVGILGTALTEEETLAGPGLVVMPAKLGGPFTLESHLGEPVDQTVFEGRPTFLYFGYTHCPDICPTTLQTMTSAMAAAGEEGHDVQGGFITVDPERDTAVHLSGYVSSFPGELTGLRGDAAAVDRVATAFRVRYALRREVDPEHYPVDHSTYVYLMDPAWQLAAVFRHDASADDMLSALRRL